MTVVFQPLGSLFGWKRYFPKGMIYGADIDTTLVTSLDRIKTFYCDQRNIESIRNLWDNDELKEGFDIIIDDGSHVYEDTIIFFENSINKLNSGGYYIIEDFKKEIAEKFIEKINNEWKLKYNDLQYYLYDIANNNNVIDNRLLVITKS